MKFFEKIGGTLRPSGRLVRREPARGQSEASEVRVADSSAPHSSSASVLPGGETSSPWRDGLRAARKASRTPGISPRKSGP